MVLKLHCYPWYNVASVCAKRLIVGEENLKTQVANIWATFTTCTGGDNQREQKGQDCRGVWEEKTASQHFFFKFLYLSAKSFIFLSLSPSYASFYLTICFSIPAQRSLPMFSVAKPSLTFPPASCSFPSRLWA